MHRRNILSWLPAVVVLTAAVLASACSSAGEEQQLLKKFFDASRMRDNTTLNNIAAVAFRPQEEGTIQSFSIVSVTPETRRTLRIKELNAAFDAAKKEDDEFTKNKKEYQDKNIEAIDRALKAERENKPLRGNDAEVQKQWTKWREETQAVSKKVSEARKAAADEQTIAALSVYDARNPVNVADYDGDLASKDVTIAAQAKAPDGQTSDKQLVVTLQRAELKNAAGEARNGRWVITGIK
jgi:hypothetical protein